MPDDKDKPKHPDVPGGESSGSNPKVESLKRVYKDSAREVYNICLQGREAKKDKNQILVFKGMYRALDRYYTQSETIWNELCDYDGFPTKEIEGFREKTRSYYYETHASYEKILADEKLHDLAAMRQAQAGGSAQNLNTTTTILTDSRSHLPIISIPEFHGQILEWPKYRDTFKSIVSNDDSLTSMQKYHYLIRSLKGPAADVITHIPKDETGFLAGWTALEKVYEKPRILAGAYLNQILNFKPIQGKPTKESLKAFVSKVSESVSSFTQLKVENESQFILFHLACQRLDIQTREQFEWTYRENPYPTFNQLTDFIRQRIMALELVEATSTNTNSAQTNSPNKFQVKSSSKSFVSKGEEKAKPSFAKREPPICVVCKAGIRHYLSQCEKFKNANVEERLDMLKPFGGCFSCLSYFHKTQSCKSKWTCRYCQQSHNSFLHQDSNVTASNSSTSAVSAITSESPVLSSTNQDNNVVLGSAIAEIRDARGIFQKVRLVVDSASQHSFLTQSALRRLGLTMRPFQSKISGIGETAFEGAKGKVECLIRPQNRSVNLHTDAVVVKSITSYLPQFPLPFELRVKFQDFELADPSFCTPGPVDFLLGAELFGDIWTGSVITVDTKSPKLFPSVFGHIVMGRYSTPSTKQSKPSDSTSLFVFSEQNDLNENLKNFWEIEEPSYTRIKGSEDDKCEEHYVKTHYRMPDGKYVVRLPFKEEKIPSLTESQFTSTRRFFNLESKLKSNEDLRKQYVEFMDEYQALGHMSPTTSPSKYVIPHHSITKEDRNKIKIRVVFDGSALTSNGSVNQHLMTGEKLQKDIRDILLNFRCHFKVFVTDIVKCYRNILVDPADRPFQHIYWRSNSTEALQKYELNTLVYGLTNSPFSALRTIRQLSIDEGEKFPLAAAILERDIFVDDLVTGASTLQGALELQKQLIGIMNAGGFSLSKWASNCKEILAEVSEDVSNEAVSLQSPEETCIKILGLQWDPISDAFKFKINKSEPIYTKRGILSTVARIYDPLGFLAPSIFYCKTFIQELWKEKLSWDQPLENDLKTRWEQVYTQLSELSNVKIPRFVGEEQNCQFQICGFSDASERGYSAVIYLRTTQNGTTNVHLLTAKTKLAPLRKISIPRLELCGSLLLATLYGTLKGFLSLLKGEILPPVFFTDSTVVLGWLRMAPYLLKTFVANRVAEVSRSTPISNWRHVSSGDNPSDCGSRGLLPSELVPFDLWWKGPSWLAMSQENWPVLDNMVNTELPELKPTNHQSLATLQVPEPFFIVWIRRFSSYFQLIRVVAVLKRGMQNFKCKHEKRNGPLNPVEINSALIFCIKAVQNYHFLKGDKNNENCFRTDFSTLSPFEDSEGVWRVGGRLEHSQLPYNSKHQILLPHNSHLTMLMIDYYHRTYYHPTPTALQAIIQTRFWVPGLRRIVRMRTFKCLKCFKYNAQFRNKFPAPKMGELPSYRVRGKRCFSHCGVDFAGPFSMRESLRRKASVSKVYLCLFVCMETKAVHLEAVTNISTDAFLAAFERFISRRALPNEMYSDRGSNFIGASNRLKDLYEWYDDPDNRSEIVRRTLKYHVTWNFQPPRAPHFGGLWEAGVKSVKRHMTLCAGETPMTFEELSTLFAKFEAILNSRPLCPLSNEPGESDYLSPAHFMVGGPFVALPEHNLLDRKMNLLSRWQVVTRLSQEFWSRWRKEYLITLQRRTKWKTSTPNQRVGDLVLLKDPHVAVMNWPLGKIIEVHPGKDGTVRVVTVKTASSIFKRPVVQLVPLLPLNTPSSES